MKVIGYLSVPYVIEVSSRLDEDGTWVRRAECAELPSCSAEAATIVEAMRKLSIRKAEVIIGMIRAGEHPPVPRQPLMDATVMEDLEDLRRDGDEHGILELLDLDEEALAPVVA